MAYTKKAKAVAKKETKKIVKKSNSSAAGFFTDLVKVTENELAQAVSLGVLAGDIRGWIDTGVYLLNAQLSGSIFLGAPNNKIAVLAGDPSAGKTYFVLSVVKYFLEENPEAGVVLFETESAITKDMIIQRGIDATRLFIVPVSTVQEWRTQTLKVLTKYKETPEKDRRPMLMALDSLGLLSTTKEMEDSESGKETKDMTRAALIKAAFRTMTLKLGVLNVPLFITNHTYEEQGKMFAQKVMSGGKGTSYANSLNLFISKAKDKTGDETTGAILTCTLKKGRSTKENTVIKVQLNYATGLNRYYGLPDYAVEAGLWKKVDKKYTLVDGSIVHEKELFRNPKNYFTEDVMLAIDKVAQKRFNYGTPIEMDDEDTELVENDTDKENSQE